MEKFKGAIFDLDGTILDSMGLWKKVDELFFTSRNMPVPEGYVQTISPMGTVGAAHYTKNTFGIKESIEEIIAEWQKTAKREYSENVSLKPYAKEFILALKEKGVTLAVATASDIEMFEECLIKNGIRDAFSFIITVREVGVGKSSPIIYEKACEKMGINPSECMVFEDIITAVLSAKKAGCYCVGVFDKSSEKDADELKSVSDKFIYDFEEMYKSLF